MSFPESGKVFVTVNKRDHEVAVPVAKELIELGFRIAATSGTARVLGEHGVEAEVVDLLLADEFAHVQGPNVRPLYCGKLLVLHNAGPGLFVGAAHDPEDFLELLRLVVAAEEDLVDRELGEDASDGPDVDWRRVLVHLEQ